MGMRHAAVVAGLALGLMSQAAKAAIVEFTSQSAFNAAAPNSTTDTFSGFSNIGVPSYNLGPLTFTSSLNLALANDGGYGNNNYIDSLANSSGQSVTSNIAVSSEIDAISFFVGTYNFGQAVQISVNGMLQLPILTASGAPSTSFIGFVSNVPITSLSFTAINEVDLVGSVQYQSVSAVPLPSSAPMFGAALIALGAAGYGLKRKSKAAAQA